MGAVKHDLLRRAELRKRAITLAELMEQEVDVFCWCNRCGHNAVLPRERLLAELGPLFPVPEIGARLRCSGCAGKDIATRPAWPGLGPVTRHQ